MKDQAFAKLVQSEDGSHTLFSEAYGQHYHSIRGALSESRHIFIETAYRHYCAKGIAKEEICIFEVGFGTGLNALLTLGEYLSAPKARIRYYTVEAYPIGEEIYSLLQFNTGIRGEKQYLLQLHQAAWDREVELSEGFVLHKIKGDLLSIELPKGIAICYFDAFSPDAQPELWSQALFSRLAEAFDRGAVLSTYSSKGDVRRCLQNAGLSVERLPGPLGKRHILRATK